MKVVNVSTDQPTDIVPATGGTNVSAQTGNMADGIYDPADESGSCSKAPAAALVDDDNRGKGNATQKMPTGTGGYVTSNGAGDEATNDMDGMYQEMVSLAESGNAVAAAAVGHGYLSGYTEVVSPETVRQLLVGAASKGHPGAMFLLHWFHCILREGHQYDEVVATRWCREAMKNGCPEALLLSLMQFVSHSDDWPPGLVSNAISPRMPNILTTVFMLAQRTTYQRHDDEVRKLADELRSVKAQREEACRRLEAEGREHSRMQRESQAERDRLSERLASLSASALEQRVRDLEEGNERLRVEVREKAAAAANAGAEAEKRICASVAAATAEKEEMRKEMRKAQAEANDFSRHVRYLRDLLRRKGIPFNEVIGHGRQK